MSLQIAVASAIVKQDGFGALYKGLSAGLLRQATYTTARLGIFQGLSDYLKKRNDGKVPRLSLLTPALLHPEHTPLFCPPLRALDSSAETLLRILHEWYHVGVPEF